MRPQFPTLRPPPPQPPPPYAGVQAGRTLLGWAGLLMTVGANTPTPVQALPSLGQALGEPALAWQAGGEVAWRIESKPDDLTKVGVGWEGLTAGQQAWIETVVTGPGVLSFSLGAPVPPANQFTFGAGVAAVIYDGLMLVEGDNERSHNQGLARFSFQVPAGQHTLGWLWRQELYSQPVRVERSGYVLAEVSWQPGSSLPIVDGLDLPGSIAVLQTVPVGESAEWGRDRTWNHDGEDAASIGCMRGRAILCLVVEGPAELALWNYFSTWCNPDDDEPGDPDFWISIREARHDNQRGYSLETWVQGDAGRFRWQRFSTLVGTGRHAVRLFYGADDASFAAWTDQVTLTPTTVDSVLGADGRAWERGGGAWEISTFGRYLWDDTAPGAVANSLAEPAWLQTTLEGPARAELAYLWLDDGMESGGRQPVLAATNDGQEVSVVRSREGGWETWLADIPAGSHSVRWTMSQTPGPTGRLLVDGLRLLPLGPEALASALEQAGQAVALSSADAWEVTEASAVAGANSVRAVARAGSEVELSLLVPAPGVLRFAWKPGAGRGYATVDSTLAVSLIPPATTDWREEEIAIPQKLGGLAEVRFHATAVPGVAAGAPLLYLDDVRVAGAATSLAEALDDPRGIWRSSVENVAAVLSHRLALDGDDAVFFDQRGLGWVERDVAGPALVAWKGLEYLRTSLDGRPAEALRIYKSNNNALHIPAGSHVLRWSDPGSFLLPQIDQVELTETPVTINQALDETTPGWMVSAGARGWASRGFSADGEDVVLLWPEAPAESAWVEQSFHGAGILSWLSMSSGTGGGTVIVDGTPITPTTATVDNVWSWQGTLLSTGRHRVRWEWQVGSLGWLDQVKLQPSAALTVGAVFSGMGLVFRTGGDAPWGVGGVPRSDGTVDRFLISVPLGIGRQSWVETTATGPAKLSFSASGGSAATPLRLLLDGREVDTQAPGAIGGGYFRSNTLTLPAGETVIRFELSGPAGPTDTTLFPPVEIKLLALQPLSPDAPQIGPTLGQPGSTWWGGGVLVGSNARSGGEPVVSAGWLVSEVQGPGRLVVERLRAGLPALFLNDQQVGAASSLALPGGLLQEESFLLPPGRVTVRWVGIGEAAALSAVRIEATPSLPLEEAFPGVGLNWVADGPSSWAGYPAGSTVNAVAPATPLGHGQATWVEADFTGPVRLDFQPAVWASDGEMALVIDGREVGWWRVRDNAAAIPRVRWPLDAGTHRVRWTVRRGSGGPEYEMAGALRGVRVLPAASLATALVVPGTSWTSSPEAPWFADRASEAALSAWEYVRPALSDRPATPWIEVSLAGPASLSFTWAKDAHAIELDGVSLAAASEDVLFRDINIVDTMPAALHLPTGTHRLRWTGAAPLKSPLVPAVPPASPGAASGENLGLPLAAWFYQNTGSGWTPDLAVRHDQTPSLRTTQGTALWLNLHGPGELRFFRKAHTASSSRETLRVFLDRESVGTWPGATDWKIESVAIPPGWHTVQWLADGLSADVAWIDDFSYVPSTSFGEWTKAAQLPLPWSGATSDTDGDGVSLFWEYALGGSPSALDVAVAAGRIEPIAGGGVAVTFPRASPATFGVRVEPEISADLLTWQWASEVPGQELIVLPATQQVTVCPPYRFVRLRAVVSP